MNTSAHFEPKNVRGLHLTQSPKIESHAYSQSLCIHLPTCLQQIHLKPSYDTLLRIQNNTVTDSYCDSLPYAYLYLPSNKDSLYIETPATSGRGILPIKFHSEDDSENEVVQYFDLDSKVLYEKSTRDISRRLHIGKMVRKTRIGLGITQEELAIKSGTTKHYISRIENEKSGIEVLTLKKIVEGLGKKKWFYVEIMTVQNHGQ